MNTLRRLQSGYLQLRCLLQMKWVWRSFHVRAIFFAIVCIAFNLSVAQAQGNSHDAASEVGAEGAGCGDQYDHTIALNFGKEYQQALKARDYARLKELKAQKDQVDLWAKTKSDTCDNRPPGPEEAGWWTNRSPGKKNTIKCDGKGSLVVHQGTVLPYGLGQCTIEHENEHIKDWIDRYGKDVCKGRKNGDLPYYAVTGKDSYSDFLKKSECGAWTIGLQCRENALKACKTAACKTYVSGQVEFGKKKKKEYCGA